MMSISIHRAMLIAMAVAPAWAIDASASAPRNVEGMRVAQAMPPSMQRRCEWSNPCRDGLLAR